MKKIFALFLFVFSYHTGFSQWQQLDSLTAIRARPSAFSIGDTGYVVAGGNTWYLYDAWKYDKAGNTWTQIANYPSTLYDDGTVGFSINDTGYVGTGAYCCYEYGNLFYKYDPHTNTWSSIASFPGAVRAGGVAFVINGKGYVGGGNNDNVSYKDFWCYTPSTNSWKQIADCPAAGVAFQAVAFSVNGYGYVGTGALYNGSSYVTQKDFWKYDPDSDKWTQVADFGGGVRYGAAGYATCDRGYVGDGVTDGAQQNYVKDFWEFDPSSGTKGKWTQIKNFGGTARDFCGTFVIGKTVYVSCGYNATGHLGQLWSYTPIDTPQFSAPSSVCTGQPVMFTDTSNYNATNWYWQFQGGTPDTSTAKNPIVTYNSTGSFDVTLTAWNSCDSGSQTFTKYINITAFPGVVSVTPDSPSVCNGQKLTLKALGGNGATYLWVSTTDTTDSIIVNPSVDTAYELLASHGTCSKDTFISVTVKQAPALIVQPSSPASVCLGQSIILSVPASGTDYTWSPSATLNKSMGDSVTATPSVQTTYLVTGIDSLGCAVTSDSEVVTINTGPSKPTIIQHDSVLISSSTQSNQWLRNDTVIQGATAQDYIVTVPGYYQVTVSNPANGCSATSDSILTSGIDQLAVESGQVTVYPNPTGGEIMVNISSSVGEMKDWNLKITDVLGRTLYTQLSLNYTNDIDISNLSSGIYFITVINKTVREVVPVMKQNL